MNAQSQGRGYEAYEDDPYVVEAKQVLDRIGLELIGRYPNGRVEVFSRFHQRSDMLRTATSVDRGKLLMICGPPARNNIASGRGKQPDKLRITDVRLALALLAGMKRLNAAGEPR